MTVDLSWHMKGRVKRNIGKNGEKGMGSSLWLGKKKKWGMRAEKRKITERTAFPHRSHLEPFMSLHGYETGVS